MSKSFRPLWPTVALAFVLFGSLPFAHGIKPTCSWELSQRGYLYSPFPKEVLEASLRSNAIGPWVREVSETFAWLGVQSPDVFSPIAAGLRKPRYNPGNGTDNGREQLLKETEAHFSEAPTVDSRAVLLSLLDHFPPAPLLSEEPQAMKKEMKTLLHQTVGVFLRNKTEADRDLLATIAADHYDPSSGGAGEPALSQNSRKKKIKETFDDPQYDRMLMTFLGGIVDDMIPTWNSCLILATCDPLPILRAQLEKFGQDRFGGPGPKLDLLSDLLTHTLLPDSPTDGNSLKSSLLETLHRELESLIAYVESDARSVSRKTSLGQPEHSGDQIPWRPLAVTGPQNAQDRAANSPPRVTKEEKPPQKPVVYSALSEGDRRALREYFDLYGTARTVKYKIVVPLLDRLFGEPRHRDGSHYVYPCPFDDRGILVLVRHGSEMTRGETKTVRDVLKKMIAHYDIM